MFQYSPILGRSSIWDLKYTFSPLYYESKAKNFLATENYRRLIMRIDENNVYVVALASFALYTHGHIRTSKLRKNAFNF